MDLLLLSVQPGSRARVSMDVRFCGSKRWNREKGEGGMLGRWSAGHEVDGVGEDLGRRRRLRKWEEEEEEEAL